MNALLQTGSHEIYQDKWKCEIVSECWDNADFLISIPTLYGDPESGQICQGIGATFCKKHSIRILNIIEQLKPGLKVEVLPINVKNG